MKKYVLKWVFLSLLAIGAGAYTASAQVYVSVHPVFAPVLRSPAPSPRHVWIDEDWVWRGGAYVAIGGRWEVPPRPGFVWIPGYWRHDRRGDRWFRGHWGRR